jgi:hypothetical protein
VLEASSVFGSEEESSWTAAVEASVLIGDKVDGVVMEP